MKLPKTLIANYLIDPYTTWVVHALERLAKNCSYILQKDYASRIF